MIKISRHSNVPEPLKTARAKNAFQSMRNFYRLSVSERRQQKFKFDPGITQKCAKPLKVLFNDKCAYCETLLSDQNTGTIDHFRPTSGAKGFKEFSDDHYWWLAYEWQNLYLACKDCVRFKQSWFPVRGNRCKLEVPYADVLKEENMILDPCHDDPEMHLDFDQKGMVIPLSDKGETTINVLKLNREHLVKQRYIKMRQIQILINALYLLKGGASNSPKDVIKLLDLVKDNTAEPYAGMQRSYLRKKMEEDPEIGQFLKKISAKLKSSFLETLQLEKLSEVKIPARKSVKKGAAKRTPIVKSYRLKAKAGKFNVVQQKNKLFKKALSTTQRLELEKIFLKRIEIKNFKAIRGLVIDFPTAPEKTNEIQSDDSIKEPWLLLLGENGVGKSTMLQAITLTLMGSEYLKNLGIPAKKILRRNSLKGYVRIFHHGSDVPFEIQFDEKRITSSHTHSPTFLLAYGSTRLTLTPNIQAENAQGNVRARNLFYPESALADAKKWIVSLYKRAEKDIERKKLFDWVGRAMKDLLLLEQSAKMVVVANDVFIRYSKTSAEPLDQLSDGYKSMITVAVDIMQTLIQDKTTMDTAQGIVLIDEIGTHLHPRWKMQVVSRLRRVFPKLQFIVTTHDPLCLRGLMKGEIAVFYKTPSRKVMALTDLPDPSGLNAEQLLGSQFFGLDSTYDGEDEERFNEYHYLLSRKKRTSQQEKRKNELSDFVREKQKIGNNNYEQVMHEIIHEKIAESKFVKPKSAIALKEETLAKIKNIWG